MTFKDDIHLFWKRVDAIKNFLPKCPEDMKYIWENKLRELTKKYNQMEHEFEKIWEENNNLRIVRNEGKVL